MATSKQSTTQQNTSQHLSNIFEEKELEENSVVKNLFTTALDGKKYETYIENIIENRKIYE